MSFQAMAWAWERRLIGPLARLALLHIANDCDQDGNVSSSVDRLVAQTGMSRTEAKEAISTLLVEDLLLADWNGDSFVGHVPFYEATAPSSLVQLRREQRLKGASWKKRRELVLTRDNFTCQYCGEKDGEMHIDHVVPISRGGTNDIENLAVACADCNSSKGQKMLITEWRPSL